MNPEETQVEMKDQTEPVRTETDATDVSDVDQDRNQDQNRDHNQEDHNQEDQNRDQNQEDRDQEDQDRNQNQEDQDQEKWPMAGDGERVPEVPANGSVRVKVLEEEEDFTGLNKEELLRVAGTPGWVRTRWGLLMVFWLGWLGMLVGAVLIILQAPRCREPPSISWWNHGPLLQVRNLQALMDTHKVKDVEQKMKSLSQLKVNGLVVGPVHVAPPDEDMNLRFEEVSPEAGNLDQFKGFIQAAHRNGISVVLDLTPNYQGSSGPWFSSSSVTNVAERLKSALVFWLSEGVDGVQLSAVEDVATVAPSLWNDIRVIIQNGTDQFAKKRVLIGVTRSSSVENVSTLLSSTGVNLLISNVLMSSEADASGYAETVQLLCSSHNQTELAWSLGGQVKGHLVSRAWIRLHLLLLLTLPGTPVFSYGNEMCLMSEDTKFPKKLQDSGEELNGTQQADQAERPSCRDLFRSLSDLRSKERSLLYGDFVLLFNSSTSLAYLRVWDQSVRYLAAFNWAEEAVVLQLSGATVPRHAEVVLSTDSRVLPEESSVDLMELQVGSGQAVLIKFPYTG